jgi:hypothetical protein
MFPVGAAAGGELWRSLCERAGIDQPEADEAERKDGEQTPHGFIVLMKKPAAGTRLARQGFCQTKWVEDGDR